MKRCGACGEEFENQFNFCPTDGNPLSTDRAVASFDYRPTIISDESLSRRLATQLAFLVQRVRVAWPLFKADPFVFLTSQIDQFKNNAIRAFARPYFRNGLLVAVAIVLCVTASITLLDKYGLSRARGDESNNLAPTVMIDLRTVPDSDSQSGIGAGEQGRVGFDKGRGEGSNPVPARSHGGGGGGGLFAIPPSPRRVPPASGIPPPHLTNEARPPPATFSRSGHHNHPVALK